MKARGEALAGSRIFLMTPNDNGKAVKTYPFGQIGALPGLITENGSTILPGFDDIEIQQIVNSTCLALRALDRAFKHHESFMERNWPRSIRAKYNCESKTFATSGALRDHMRRTHNIIASTLILHRDYTICKFCQRELLWSEWNNHIVHQKGKLKGETRICLVTDQENWPEACNVRAPRTTQERADTLGYKVESRGN
ncbi:hypothetical protein DOTSEDRAFT_21042 [Dothistroma septosporum NZE10]|uniref:Uncharacterized protein n=1 Tax=Dothistroma septosporum (strain NZE10 / CBS 128990) TaxID=675120 RepID=N1PV48_DOTSN|nr:hypothetical protein DOTSEDRAFT_21042 [Dothistroma septosporum NZE10]